MRIQFNFRVKNRSFNIVFTIIFITIALALILFIRPQLQEKEKEKFASFEIDNLSVAQIVDGKDSCWESGTRYSLHGGGSSQTDYDNGKFSMEKISGIKTISSTLLKSGTLTLEIESKLDSGEMKIVLIQGNEIIEYIQPGVKVTRTFTTSKNSKFY